MTLPQTNQFRWKSVSKNNLFCCPNGVPVQLEWTLVVLGSWFNSEYFSKLSHKFSEQITNFSMKKNYNVRGALTKRIFQWISNNSSHRTPLFVIFEIAKLWRITGFAKMYEERVLGYSTICYTHEINSRENQYKKTSYPAFLEVRSVNCSQSH